MHHAPHPRPTGRYGGQPVDLDLVDTLRSTGAAREFHPEPVVRRCAGPPPRHGPLRAERRQPPGLAGHRRQGPRRPRRRCATSTSRGWYDYLAMVVGRPGALGAGHRPRRRGGGHRQRRAVRRGGRGRARRSPRPSTPRPHSCWSWPTCGALAAVDRDLPRYTLAGGASIYPFVWSLLLAARAEGLGGVMTTMPVRREDDVRAALRHPRHRGGGGARRARAAPWPRHAG